MNDENILRLLYSNSYEDKVLGCNFLNQRDISDIIKFFDIYGKTHKDLTDFMYEKVYPTVKVIYNVEKYESNWSILESPGKFCFCIGNYTILIFFSDMWEKSSREFYKDKIIII